MTAENATGSQSRQPQANADGPTLFLIDGDNVRQGLNKDLGFTDAHRVENIWRVEEIALLVADAGLIVLTAFISPAGAERALVRQMMAEGEFIEVHVTRLWRSPRSATERAF